MIPNVYFLKNFIIVFLYLDIEKLQTMKHKRKSANEIILMHRPQIDSAIDNIILEQIFTFR